MALCALAGLAVWQFFGNASLGYIKSSSVFYWWGYQWINPQSETEHGWLILGLSVWLLWRNLTKSDEGRPAFVPSGGTTARQGVSDETSWPAAVAMVAALALHALGFAAQQTRVSIVALLLFIWGVLRLGGGRRWGAAAMFPLGFMVFAIPFNVLDSAGFWLRLWVIKASTGLAHVSGINVIQNGTQLLAPDGRYSYDVAAACSGVRSLMALLALSLLAGYLNFQSWWRRGLLLLLCFPLVYLGNVARISSIVFVAQWGGQARGEATHEVMGYGIFVIVLGGVLLAASTLRRWWPEKAVKSEDPPSPGFGAARVKDEERERGAEIGKKFWGVAGCVAVLAIGEMVFFSWLAGLPPRGQVGVRLAADGLNPVELPVFLGTEWIGKRAEVTAIEREMLPADTGFSRKSYVAVAEPTQRVFLSIVLSGRDRTSIHRPELCLVGEGLTITGATEHRFRFPGRADPGVAFPVTVLHLQREVRTPRGPVILPEIVAYWFVGGDRVVATHWQRLAADAWNRVVHARADRWAYVLVQTDARDGEAAALARMQAVLNETLPVFAQPPAARAGR